MLVTAMIRKTIILMLTLGAIGTGFLWALSYWTPVTWRTRNLDDIPTVTTAAEMRIPLAFEFELRDGIISAGNLYIICGNPRNRQFKFTGIEFVNLIEKRSQFEKAALIAPFWLPPLLLLTYPAIAFISGPFRRWRRHRRGLCLGCGYDLTGNESGICPECGKPT